MTKWTPINPDDYKNLKTDDLEDDEDLELEGLEEEDDEDEDTDQEDTGKTDDEISFSTNDEEEDEEPAVPKKSRANERIRELNAKAKEAERRAEEAEKARAALVKALKDQKQELFKAKKDKQETLKNTVESQKVSYAAILEATKKQLTKAHEEDNSEAIVELTAKLGDAQLALKALDSWKPDPILEPEEEEEEEVVVQKQPKLENAPKATQTWIKNNSWFLDPEGRDDIERIQEVKIYNESLIRKGYDPESKEFYDLIDKRLIKLGLAKDKEDDLDSEEEETSSKSGDVKNTQKKKISQKVLGTSRSSSRKAPPSNKITLSAEEKSLADLMGVSYLDYAKEKRKLEIAEKQGSSYVKIFKD